MNAEGFRSLRDNTMLLESLDWDESKLATLFTYLEEAFGNDEPVHPDVIINTIESNFGEIVSACFTSILKEIMLEHNLHFYGE